MLSPKYELNWIERELQKLSDKMFILAEKPYEQIEHRLHSDLTLPLENLLAAAKNLEKAFELKDIRKRVRP